MVPGRPDKPTLTWNCFRNSEWNGGDAIVQQLTRKTSLGYEVLISVYIQARFDMAIDSLFTEESSVRHGEVTMKIGFLNIAMT